MEELRRIEADVYKTETIDDLRSLFDRVQALRRTYVEDFDVQLRIGQVQQEIIDRGQVLIGDPAPALNVGRTSVPFQEATSPASSARRTETRAVPASGGSSSHPLPAGVEPMDIRTWKRSIYVGAFFAVLLFAGFFYLIQTARKLNLSSPDSNQTSRTAGNGVSKPSNAPVSDKGTAVTPVGPSLRLYTDLVPGTVSFDGGAPQDLNDGEFQVDTLKPGRHEVKLSGRTGDAALAFDVQEKAAPRLASPPTGNNALVVTASTYNGKSQLMTNGQYATALIDNKPAGDVPPTGLTLENLGVIDHNLEIKRAHDSQRFILTYTSAPALTVFVKSDPNAGSLVVVAGEDGVNVIVNDKPYRRKTEHGQVRIPSLKVGDYTVQVKKAGYVDSPSQTVHIKKGEEARVEFHLQVSPQIAALQLRGTQPGTQLFLDRDFVSTAGPEGNASVPGVKPGDHSIELKRDGFQPKRFVRTFKAGETVTLSGPDVALEKIVAESKPAPMPPPEPAPAPASPEPQPPSNVAANVHKGGGFIIYSTPKGAQRYDFNLQLRKGGGFLKSKRLQWFVDFKDTKNYVVYQLDGKHFTAREVVDGKSKELQKSPFNGSPEDLTGVEISLKPNSVDTRLKSADGTWQDMGPVTSPGRDFTLGKVGVLVAGNDEVRVSNFRIAR
jgi:hypothetical protein